MKRAFTMIELLTVVAVIAILAGIAVPNFLEAQIRTKATRVRMDMASLAAGARAYYSDYDVYPRHHRDVAAFFSFCADAGPLADVKKPKVAAYTSTAEWLSEEEPQPQATQKLATPDRSAVSWTAAEAEANPRPLDALASFEVHRMSTVVTRVGAFPPFEVSGYALDVLTTPVAYVSQERPSDIFADARDHRFKYVNLSEVETTNTLLRGYLKQARFYLMSYGPNTDQRAPLTSTMMNPITGPYVSYDPTNGTVSEGDVFAFGMGE